MSELLSLNLARERLTLPDSEIQAMIHGLASGDAIEVESSPGHNSSHVEPQIFLPRGIHLLSPQSRALAVAAVWRTVLLRVGEERSWGLGRLDPLLKTLAASDFACDVETDWLVDGSNGNSVRLIGSLFDDGYFRLRFEMREGGAESTRLSDPFLAGSSIESFRRFAQSLKRLPDGRLQGASSPFGPENSETGVVSVDLVSGALRIEGGPGVVPLSQVTSDIEANIEVSVRKPDPGAVFRGSFGPTNDAPRAYLDELSRLMGLVADDHTWKDWLRATPAAIVDLRVFLDASEAKVQVRKASDRITVGVSRPVASIPISDASAAEQARLDVTKGLESLRTRFGLGDLPSWGPARARK